MRPNSKTYNPDFGSSFFYNKPSYKTFQSKTKPSEGDRWDHGGYEKLQFEQQDKPSKFAKSRKTPPDNTLAADFLDSSTRGRGIVQEKSRWTHDKYPETLVDFPPLTNKEEDEGKEVVQVQESKPRREKKPDRQLYSVRQKCSTKVDEVRKSKESAMLNCSVIEKREDVASPYLKTVKEVLKAFDEKEVHSLEEDKLSISNVSTAMSDRLKNWEEESYLKSELLKERVDSSEMIQSPKNKEPVDVLFDIVLEAENGIISSIRIYQGEDNYEAVLDKACINSNFDARTSLYFKINVFQMIMDSGAGGEKVNAIFNRLLDINYKLLMHESGFCEADESIAPYLVVDKENNNRENESILKNLEDSY